MSNTKKSLLASGIALMICITLLVGTSFAWFTDSVTNSGNKIQAGTLLIDAYCYDIGSGGITVANDNPELNNGQPISFENAGQNLKESDAPAIINEDIFEPGKSNAKLIKVSNSGTLAAKIKLNFNITDNGLTDALWFDFIRVDENGAVEGTFVKRPMSTLTELADKVEISLNGENSTVLYMLVYGMDENAGNTYRDKTFSADVSILAKQDTYESDGFGNDQYDAGAVWPAANTAEFNEALTKAEDGDTIALTSNIVLDRDLNINKNITIDGMNNAVISDKPVNVGATNKVALKNITFTAPDNSSETHPVNNASSLYANDFSGSLIIDGCTFVDAPWDALQITPFEGAEIIITNNIFANDAITGYRYVHIQNVTGTEIRATIKMNGNDFKGVADMTDGGAICIEGIIYDESIVDYSGNTFDVDDLSPNGDNLAYLWLADGFAYSGNVVNYDNLLDPEVYCK